MPRILFLVNNNALSDTRVVKTAEVFNARGFQCTVLGCDRNIATIQETEQNGVAYRIAPLHTAIAKDLFAGYFPKVYGWCIKLRPSQQWQQAKVAAPSDPATDTPAPTPLRSTNAADLSASTTQPTSAPSATQDPAATIPLPPLKQVAKPIVGVARRGYRWLRYLASLPRRYLVQRLQPRHSPAGAKALFGRYLRTFYPQLVATQTDITYCHELWLLEASSLSKTAGATTTLAYDSHELESHRHNDWSDAANATRVAYEAKYIQEMHTVVTVCQSIAEHMQQDYKINMPFVVPNAPLNSRAVAVDNSMKLKQSLAIGDRPLAVYTGKVTTGRGLPTILQVLEKIPELHLAIVGPRVATVASAIADQANQLGLADRVHFVDAVAPQVLVSAISDADLAVIPIENVCLSYYYSLPNKIYEAALAGLPALVSNFPELTRFTERYATGVTVDFTNLDEVVAKISQLLENPQKYNTPSKANQLRSELSFDFALAKVTDQLRSIHPT